MGLSDFDKFIIELRANDCLAHFNRIKDLDISEALASAIECLRDPLAEDSYGA